MDYKEYFRQCNEDRRETERKRDQLIAFYTVIVGAYFAFAKDIQPDSSPAELIHLRDAFTLAIAVLGLVLAITLNPA